MSDRLRRVLSVVPVLTALVVLAAVPMPMFAVGPGPARDVIPRIRVDRVRVHEPTGQLLLTTVSLRRPSALRAVAAWLDTYVDVVPERQILPPGVSEAEDAAIQRSQMDESKLTAASVALERVTDYPRAHGAGALVRTVEPGSPAEGHLFPGDLIVRIDGTPVTSPADAVARVRAAAPGGTIEVVVRVDDRHTRTVPLRPRGTSGGPPRIGAELIANFPFPVVIESGEIGGPSAGMMWALGLVDLLTPGGLTGGRRIAGTGTIDLAGRVGAIGGIGQKVVAADRSGADVFLVPRADLAAARAADPGLELVPVDDLEDALDYLLSTCGCPRF